MSTKMDAVTHRPGSAAETVFPPADPSTVLPLTKFLEQHARDARLVSPEGITTEIPEPVLAVLRDVATAMSLGRAITVAPVSLALTTSQAADILGVSRPTLIKLLDDGEISYERPRRHRLLRLDDVLAYKERRHQRASSRLAELTRQAVADGLYDEDPAPYADALRDVRHAG